MKKPLKILILEDSADDTQLMLLQLEQEGIEVEWQRVETEADFAAALATQPDLILSDFSLPSYNGIKALALLNERGLDIPFILVSGTIGEEVAVTAMKYGAADYLLKDRLARLGESMKGALEQKRLREERKKSGEDLAASETELRALFASMKDIVFVIDRNGVYQKIAPTQPDLLVKPAEDLLGKTLRDVFPAEQAEAFISTVQQVLEMQQTAQIEYQLVIDGQVFWFETSISPMQADSTLWVARDITERKRAEEKLLASELRYRRLFESAKDGILILDSDTGMIVDVNPFLITLLGYSKEAFLGKNIWELGFFKDIVANRENFLELQQKEYIRYENLPLETAYGQQIHVEFVSNVYEVDHKKVIQCNIRNISERKRAETQIQRQLQHLNSLRAIDTAISSSFDLHVTLDIVLQQVLSQLGVDAAALLLFNPHEQTTEYAASRGFRSNAIQHTQLKLSKSYAGRAMSERRTIHVSNLLETNGKLTEAMQLASEGFVDYHGTPLIAKDGIKGVLETYHRSPVHPDPDWLDFLETLAGQAAIAIDNSQLFEGLQRANAELEQRVIQRTKELNQTNIELEHANRAKDEFLATMSHELRTPLNSILGLSETLLEQRRDPLSANQQRSLQIIASSGQHLLELINDILDLSKIEAGKFDYYPQIIAVGDLCRGSLAFVKEQATRKSITITYQEETTVSKIYADPRRLKQILVNLFTNAVKFTPEHGQIILQVRADEEQDRIEFSVIDTGIGISSEDLKKLFQPFVQVDSSLTREYEGTGLGLALVHKLTDLHGGSVTVESEVGKGSRFTINLPLFKAMLAKQEIIEAGGELLSNEQAGKSNIPSDEPVNRGVVLLAEDNMANIQTVGDYLESHGYQVLVAHDGVEALEKAGEVQPNIILMDIQMPVMDGLEATRRLRVNPRFASTPIIALTALTMPGDRERCLEAGANEYMSKPASLKTLVKTIRQLLGRKT